MEYSPFTLQERKWDGYEEIHQEQEVGAVNFYWVIKEMKLGIHGN